MKYTALILTLLMLSSIVHAQNADHHFKIEKTTYHDGVLITPSQTGLGVQITVAGPESFRVSHQYAADEPIFIDINNMADRFLMDGLYRYEVRPETGGFDSPPGLVGIQISPVHGSFRIRDGVLVDPALIENENGEE